VETEVETPVPEESVQDKDVPETHKLDLQSERPTCTLTRSAAEGPMFMPAMVTMAPFPNVGPFPEITEVRTAES